MVMVAFNKNMEDFSVDTSRFSELISGKSHGRDVISEREFDLGNLVLPARSVLILELY
jgi:hypothetical protein